MNKNIYFSNAFEKQIFLFIITVNSYLHVRALIYTRKKTANGLKYNSNQNHKQQHKNDQSEKKKQ